MLHAAFIPWFAPAHTRCVHPMEQLGAYSILANKSQSCTTLNLCVLNRVSPLVSTNRGWADEAAAGNTVQRTGLLYGTNEYRNPTASARDGGVSA